MSKLKECFYWPGYWILDTYYTSKCTCTSLSLSLLSAFSPLPKVTIISSLVFIFYFVRHLFLFSSAPETKLDLDQRIILVPSQPWVHSSKHIILA